MPEKVNSFKEKFKKLSKKSLLCVGLDTDYAKLPPILKKQNSTKSILKFNKEVIKHTSHLVCCYKLNSAFYEAEGYQGIKVLKETIDYIKSFNIPVIVDAKRCDIGNSSRQYAKYVFNYLEADAVTVIPYMGIEGIEPFLKYTDRFVFTVALSSNISAREFQNYPEKNPLYLRVIKKLYKKNNTGFVVGATSPEIIKKLRNMKIKNIFLIPGLGSQKGSIKSIKYATLNNSPAIFNVSRSIIYAFKSEQKDFIKEIVKKAEEYFNLINQTRSDR